MSDTSDSVGEDDLNTFEGFLRYQAVDPATTKPKELEAFRQLFNQAKATRAATPPMGELFKPKPNGQKQDEFKYAVAIRVGTDLWLTMTVSNRLRLSDINGSEQRYNEQRLRPPNRSKGGDGNGPRSDHRA